MTENDLNNLECEVQDVVGLHAAFWSWACSLQMVMSGGLSFEKAQYAVA